MGLLEKAKAELLDIVEWTDDAPDTMVWKFPRYENEIKYGAQLIVRPAQAAVFVDRGNIADVFGPGQYSLTTKNLPVLSTLMGWAYGFHSPFKAEAYFVTTRNFTNLKWGTRNPVILRDPEFGPVRLRSFGTFVVRVADPAQLIREVAGTAGRFGVEEISDQLRNLIVARFSDMLGERNIPVLDLASNYDELSAGLTDKVAPEFLQYGIQVTKLVIENISLPPEVEEALDKKSSMGIIGNLDSFVKFQSATAMEAAARNPGGDASSGVGMGMGFAMANQLGKTLVAQEAATAGAPPFPEAGKAASYFVGKDGKKAGPFPKDAIAAYVRKGSITRDTLMWKEGMQAWDKAGSFSEFAEVFAATPPPLPE